MVFKLLENILSLKYILFLFEKIMTLKFFLNFFKLYDLLVEFKVIS